MKGPSSPLQALAHMQMETETTACRHVDELARGVLECMLRRLALLDITPVSFAFTRPLICGDSF